jgi:hypothetical protein
MPVEDVDPHIAIDPLAAWMTMRVATGSDMSVYPTGGPPPMWGGALAAWAADGAERLFVEAR